jgi:hypothetical protein
VAFRSRFVRNRLNANPHQTPLFGWTQFDFTSVLRISFHRRGNEFVESWKRCKSNKGGKAVLAYLRALYTEHHICPADFTAESFGYRQGRPKNAVARRTRVYRVEFFQTY